MAQSLTNFGDPHKKQSLARYIINGFIMGLGELLPGVGTQTVAILLGIYDECMSAGYRFADFGGILTLFLIGRTSFAKVKAAFWHVPWKFFITMGVMSVLTFLILSGILNDIFISYPVQFYAGAFGIVLATAVILYSEIQKKGLNEIIVFLGSLILFFILIEYRSGFIGHRLNPLTMFFAGFFCSVAAVLPGISLTFVMLVVGVYQYVITTSQKIMTLQFTTMEIINMAMFILGFNLGVGLVIKTLKYFMDKYPSLFLAFLMGLIVASLRVVWPFIDLNSAPNPERMTKISPFGFTPLDISSVIIIAAVTFAIILVLRYFAEKRGFQISTLHDTKEFETATDKEQMDFASKFNKKKHE